MAVALSSDADQQRRSGYIQVFRQAGKAEALLLDDDGLRLREIFEGCPPERIASYVDPLLEPGALTPMLNWYRALSDTDLSGLGPVTVPTTFIWGDQDVAIGALAAERCAEFVTADFRFVPLAGVSHWVPDQAPDQVAAAVLARIQGAES
jgi:pimeloyl-ACP methyl ester carboxylesterase